MADHDRINITHTSISCGVRGLNRISSDIENVLYALATDLYHPSRGQPATFYIASDLHNEATNTSKLMNEVKDRAFGEVVVTRPADNPKTGNTIVVFVWRINHYTFKSWYAKERTKRLSKVGT